MKLRSMVQVSVDNDMQSTAINRHVASAHSYLKLENLCERLVFPCVLDVKIGARNCGPDASEEKLLLDLSKYQWATTLGFRFLGYKVSYSEVLSYTPACLILFSPDI